MKHRYRAAVLPVLGALAALPGGPARAQLGGPMSDYMLMRVCTATASPTAPPLPGVVPGDASCKYSRQIGVGETPPYTLRDFAPNYIANASSSCASLFGPLLRGNVPVTQNGLTQTVVFSQTGVSDATCQSAQTVGSGSGTQVTDISVQAYDPVTGYGYIMGSSGPNGITFNDAYDFFPNGSTTPSFPAGGTTPVCKSGTDPWSSARFSDDWLVGLSPVARSLPGPIQFATVNLQLLTPTQVANNEVNGPACSTPYVGGFHIWRTDWFMFYSGRLTTAVIAQHYTQANPDNAGPGPAQAMERTYWTREFGLSRWEKWTRGDYVAGGNPGTLSQQLLSHAVCAQPGRSAGVPYPIITNPADSSTSGSMTLSGSKGIYQNVVGPDGATYTWYLTLCADYTNIDRSVTGQPLPSVPAAYAPLWTP